MALTVTPIVPIYGELTLNWPASSKHSSQTYTSQRVQSHRVYAGPLNENLVVGFEPTYCILYNCTPSVLLDSHRVVLADKVTTNCIRRVVLGILNLIKVNTPTWYRTKPYYYIVM